MDAIDKTTISKIRQRFPLADLSKNTENPDGTTTVHDITGTPVAIVMPPGHDGNPFWRWKAAPNLIRPENSGEDPQPQTTHHNGQT